MNAIKLLEQCLYAIMPQSVWNQIQYYIAYSMNLNAKLIPCKI